MAAAMRTDRLLCKSGLLSYSEGANGKALGDTGLVKQLHPTLPLDFQKRGEWRHKRTVTVGERGWEPQSKDLQQ